VFLSIAVLASVAILPQLNRTMWRDEGASLYSAHLSWGTLWQQSRVVDRALLPYYSFLHVWLAISGNIEWARAPSLVAFGLTVFIVGRFANRLGGLWCGVSAALITATSPLMIEAALEARPYALATLLATISAVALVHWYESGSTRWFWCFSLAAILVVALQIFLVLAPFAVLILAVAIRPQKFAARWRNLLVPLGLLCFSTLYFAALVAGQNSQIAWIGPITAGKFSQYISGPASGGPSLLGEPAYRNILFVAMVIVIVLCARVCQRGGLRFPRIELDALVLSLSWAILPTAVLIAISIFKPEYQDRYVTASVPAMAVVIGLVWSRAFQESRHKVSVDRTALLGTSLTALVLLLITSVASSREFVENLQEAAQYVALQAGRSGEFALPDHSLTAGIDYYFRTTHEIVSNWPERANQHYIEGLDLRDGPRTIAHAPANVWLVNDGSVRGTDEFIALLKRNGYVTVGTKEFAGTDLLEVEHFHRSAT